MNLFEPKCTISEIQKPDFDDALLPDARKKIVENPLSLRNPITQSFFPFSLYDEKCWTKSNGEWKRWNITEFVVAERDQKTSLVQISNPSGVRTIQSYRKLLIKVI